MRSQFAKTYNSQSATVDLSEPETIILDENILKETFKNNNYIENF